MRSQGEVQRPLGLLYLKIHNETNFKKRCSGGWLYVYVAECTEHVGASSKEAVVVKRLLCIGSLVRSLWALARVRYGRLREICTLSLWCAGQRPDHQHTHKLTINTSTTWPSTQAQVQPNNEQLSSQASINTTSTTISNQQHWIQRTFLRHSGQVTGNYSPMKISKLHTKRYSSSKKQISEVKNLKAY